MMLNVLSSVSLLAISNCKCYRRDEGSWFLGLWFYISHRLHLTSHPVGSPSVISDADDPLHSYFNMFLSSVTLHRCPCCSRVGKCPSTWLQLNIWPPMLSMFLMMWTWSQWEVGAHSKGSCGRYRWVSLLFQILFLLAVHAPTWTHFAKVPDQYYIKLNYTTIS